MNYKTKFSYKSSANRLVLCKLTYSYKKVHHKKYIECKINLLRDIVAPFLTSFHFFIGCVNKVNDEWCNAEDKHEDHLKKERHWIKYSSYNCALVCCTFTLKANLQRGVWFHLNCKFTDICYVAVRSEHVRLNCTRHNIFNYFFRPKWQFCIISIPLK